MNKKQKVIKRPTISGNLRIINDKVMYGATTLSRKEWEKSYIDALSEYGRTEKEALSDLEKIRRVASLIGEKQEKLIASAKLDPSPDVRIAALEFIKDVSVIGKIAIEDQDMFVRETAVSILKAMASGWSKEKE